MLRLVCVVEGHGESEAAPVLCQRVLRTLLKAADWHVDEDPVRCPRGLLVDEKVASPRRPPNLSPQGLPRALALAASRRPDAVLVLCDADDDCPAAWGPKVPALTPAANSVAVRGVMVNREYESWLLWAFPEAERVRAKAPDPEREPRNAKKALQRLVPGYTPTTHQLEQTRKLDLAAVWGHSDSFDKFVRSIAALVQVEPPARPLPGGQTRRSPVAPSSAQSAEKRPPRGRAAKTRR